MKSCIQCGKDINPKNRLCPACAKQVKKQAYADGKIRQWNIKTFSDARGRPSRSWHVIGGAPKTGNEE